MTEHLDPLDPEIRDLLSKGKPLVELAPDRKEAIFAATSARLGLGGAGSGTPPDGSSSSGATGPSSPTGSSSSGAASPARAAGDLASAGFSTTRAVAALLATFALGVGSGVALDRHVLSSSTSSTPSAASTSAATTPPPSPPSSTVDESLMDPPSVPVSALPTAHAPTASTGAPSVKPNDVTPSARGLAAERALLDVARTALASGDLDTALAASERHAKEYPTGSLVEEREVIAVKGLAALGRREEAQARARAFEKRFPGSLSLRAVRNAAFGVP